MIDQIFTKTVYNYENETKALYCNDCKLEDMINIKDKRCIKCNTTRPTFNYEKETKALYCSECAEVGMVDILNKRCIEPYCRKFACFSLPGVIPKYCSSHKKEGMMKNPRRNCSECKEPATYGLKEPVHCEDHKTNDEYLLTERHCSKFNRLDILNKDGICVNFCSHEERDRLIKKQIKKHEEYTNKLLDAEIPLQPYAKDIIIDSECSKFRPDRVYHCGDHIVIIEVDENQHKSYTNCGYTKEEKLAGENRRMFSIGQSFDGLQVTFLRYNPDHYIDSTGKKGSIINSKRHDILVRWVKHCIESKEFQGFQVKYLFYDGYDEKDTTFTPLNEKMLSERSESS